jgi:hypothetical protein
LTGKAKESERDRLLSGKGKETCAFLSTSIHYFGVDPKDQMKKKNEQKKARNHRRKYCHSIKQIDKNVLHRVVEIDKKKAKKKENSR